MKKYYADLDETLFNTLVLYIKEHHMPVFIQKGIPVDGTGQSNRYFVMFEYPDDFDLEKKIYELMR